MTLSAFDDPAGPPDDAELAAALGESQPLWAGLLAALEADLGPLAPEWGNSGGKTGWGLRVRRAGRIVLYLAPRDGYFLASFALGERAVAAALAGELSATARAVIEGARRYAEGRGVRLEVRTADDVGDVRRLAAVKVAH